MGNFEDKIVRFSVFPLIADPRAQRDRHQKSKGWDQ